MTATILGLGTAAPEHALSQTELATLVAARSIEEPRHASVVETLFRRSGVARRGVCLEQDDPRDFENFYDVDRSPTTSERMERFRNLAPPLAARACHAALEDAGLRPEDVTHLVIVTCTGFAAPGVEIDLIGRLGLAATVTRTQIGFMGCHAALNGLQVADALARAEPTARVLLCSVELCSLHLRYGWSSERLVTNALFADGAAALVIGTRTTPAPEWTIESTTSMLIESSEDQMSWTIEDDGFAMTLSPRVPATIAQHLQPWVDDWLRLHGLDTTGVRSWAIHAGGPRIVQTVADRLELDANAIHACRCVLRDHGNMSSATVLFVLEALRQRNVSGPCVLLAFGPGLIAEAALLIR